MYPLQSIIEFMLTGVGRIPPAEQPDALCNIFAGLLPEMSEDDIATARLQVAARFWNAPEVCDSVLNLIDGHLAWRALADAGGWDGDEAGEAGPGGDFEV